MKDNTFKRRIYIYSTIPHNGPHLNSMVNNASLIAKASLRVEDLSTTEILEGAIEFWHVNMGFITSTLFETEMGKVWLRVDRTLSATNYLQKNKLEKALNHAVYNIDNFLSNRKRLFKVIETNLVATSSN